MNTESKKVLFIVHTEYHLMCAICKIVDYYLPNLYKSYIIQAQSTIGINRFNFNLACEYLVDVDYVVIKYDLYKRKFNKELHDLIGKILLIRFDELVVFNQHEFLDIYLTRELFKRGTTISLAMDGAKAYTNIKRLAPRWRLKESYNYLQFILCNRLRGGVSRILIPGLVYADLPEIEIIWIEYSNAFKNLLGKKIRKINMLGSSTALLAVNQVFGFNSSVELKKTSNVVFYVSQALNDDKIIRIEIDILAKLMERFKNYSLVLKLHPATKFAHKNSYSKLSSSLIIDKPYPAELYIKQLNNSIILSFWSTAMLVENSKCRFYWLYPILKKSGLMLNYLNIYNPTDYIKEVYDVMEIN